nr:hypothetical protein CFP56_12028 [Quercus suber]
MNYAIPSQQNRATCLACRRLSPVSLPGYDTVLTFVHSRSISTGFGFRSMRYLSFSVSENEACGLVDRSLSQYCTVHDICRVTRIVGTGSVSNVSAHSLCWTSTMFSSGCITSRLSPHSDPLSSAVRATAPHVHDSIRYTAQQLSQSQECHRLSPSQLAFQVSRPELSAAITSSANIPRCNNLPIFHLLDFSAEKLGYIDSEQLIKTPHLTKHPLHNLRS